jgi:hypothetical protein
VTFPALPLAQYPAIRASIRNGDLLLASGNYAFSKIIQAATKTPWSHVAMLIRVDVIDRVMVLESVETKGVRAVALSEYVRNFEGTGKGYNGRLVLAHHSGFTAASAAQLQAMSQFAVDRLSYPYDEEEIARITARIVGGALGIPPGVVARNKEYICSEYVGTSYELVNIIIPYDPRGFIAPADFARCPEVTLLYELEVQR